MRFIDWLTGLFDGVRVLDVNPVVASLVVVGVVLVVAAIAYVVAGPVRLSRRARTSAAVFDDDERSATELRAAATAAAATGDWATAVVERYRAVIRSLEERVVLDPRPGRTAHEAADAAALRLPSLTDRLAAGARLFDDVRYGRWRSALGPTRRCASSTPQPSPRPRHRRHSAPRAGGPGRCRTRRGHGAVARHDRRRAMSTGLDVPPPPTSAPSTTSATVTTAYTPAPVVGDGTTARSRARRRWRAVRWPSRCCSSSRSSRASPPCPGPPSPAPARPRQRGEQRSRALAQVLSDQGVDVDHVTTTADAVARAGAGATLLVTSDVDLLPEQIDAILATEADLVLVEPGYDLLEGATEGTATPADDWSSADAARAPDCADPDAVAAGSIRSSGYGFTATGPGSTVCFRVTTALRTPAPTSSTRASAASSPSTMRRCSPTLASPRTGTPRSYCARSGATRTSSGSCPASWTPRSPTSRARGPEPCPVGHCPPRPAPGRRARRGTVARAPVRSARHRGPARRGPRLGDHARTWTALPASPVLGTRRGASGRTAPTGSPPASGSPLRGGPCTDRRDRPCHAPAVRAGRTPSVRPTTRRRRSAARARASP
ncbi:DUF4350 domain-containing protein [Oerskovia sp. M15]